MVFKLTVNGIGSDLTAFLHCGSTLIEEWHPKSIKDAQKDAAGLAYQHKAANTPSDVTTHELSFVL